MYLVIMKMMDVQRCTALQYISVHTALLSSASKLEGARIHGRARLSGSVFLRQLIILTRRQRHQQFATRTSQTTNLTRDEVATRPPHHAPPPTCHRHIAHAPPSHHRPALAHAQSTTCTAHMRLASCGITTVYRASSHQCVINNNRVPVINVLEQGVLTPFTHSCSSCVLVFRDAIKVGL